MKYLNKVKKLFKSNFFSSTFLVVMILFLYLPLLIVFIFSFNNSGQTWSFSGFDFGFKYYGDLFKQSLFLRAIFLSFLISILSTIISVIIGTLAAISFQRLSRKSQAVIHFFNNIPLINADIIIGASLMILFIALACPFGFFTLLAAHISFSVPYVTLTVLAKLKTVNKYYLDASLDLGATPWYTIKKVIFPLIKNGIFAGAAIAFAMSIDDFIISYFSSGSLQNYSIFIYTMRHFQPFVNAFGVLLILFLVILFICFQYFTVIKKKKSTAISSKNTFISKKWNFIHFLLAKLKSKGEIIPKTDKENLKLEKQKKWSFNPFKKFKDHKKVKTYSILFILCLAVAALMGYYIVSNSHVITLAVWSEYFTDNSIAKWEEQSGWRVDVITYSSNEELRNKLNTASFDVMMPSDYFVSLLKKADLIQPLNSVYINHLIQENDHTTDKQDGMFQMVNDVYDKIPIDNDGDHLTSKDPEDVKGYFFPSFIQNIQILIRNGLSENQESPWRQLWNGIKNGKQTILQDDPRLVFEIGKINIFLDGQSDPKNKSYEDCFGDSNFNNNGKFINFTSPQCVTDVYNYIKAPIKQNNVSIHSDDIDTYLNMKKFDYALVYNSSFVESLAVISSKWNYQVKNAYFPSSSNQENNNDAQVVNADGFVINKDLSSTKKEVAENLIAYLLSYDSGIDSTDNYYFTIPNDKIFQHYYDKYSPNPEDQEIFKSLYWLDSDTTQLPSDDIKEWVKVWKKQMFNENSEVLDYNLNDEIANYYNLLLKS